MKSILIYAVIIALVGGVATEVGTVEIDGVLGEDSFIGTISTDIAESSFITNMNYHINAVKNTVDMSEIFDYEALVQAVAVSLHKQGVIPDIRGEIFSLDYATNFVRNLPVK